MFIIVTNKFSANINETHKITGGFLFMTLEERVAVLEKQVKELSERLEAHKSMIASNAENIHRNKLSILEKIEQAAIQDVKENPYNYVNE